MGDYHFRLYANPVDPAEIMGTWRMLMTLSLFLIALYSLMRLTGTLVTYEKFVARGV